MLNPITDEEYEYLHEKYHKLVLKAANRIYGDQSRDMDDYAQEIWFIILDYLPRYLKKHNKTLKEFCEDPIYNGYIKQWIWTTKNHIGKQITEKNDKSGLVLSIIATRGSNDSASTDEIFLQKGIWNEEQIPSLLTELREGKSIYDKTLSSIAFDVDSIKDNGAFNIAAISRKLGVPPNLINSEIKKIKKEFKNAIKNS